MQLISIILMDIMLLTLVFYIITIDRRMSKIETKFRQELNMMTERLWTSNRETEALRKIVNSGIANEPTKEEQERSIQEEQRFNEAIANILGYGASSGSNK